MSSRAWPRWWHVIQMGNLDQNQGVAVGDGAHATVASGGQGGQGGASHLTIQQVFTYPPPPSDPLPNPLTPDSVDDPLSPKVLFTRLNTLSVLMTRVGVEQREKWGIDQAAHHADQLDRTQRQQNIDHRFAALAHRVSYVEHLLVALLLVMLGVLGVVIWYIVWSR